MKYAAISIALSVWAIAASQIVVTWKTELIPVAVALVAALIVLVGACFEGKGFLERILDDGED